MSSMGVLFAKLYVPNQVDIPDLTGKVAIVTGGNTGIGYYTVQQLAKHGAKVYMGARNEGKALNALAQLESEGIPKGRVVWLKLDLSTVAKARSGAMEFLNREKRLNILVNNAGILSGPATLNEDGVLLMMATNHIGPFVFTNTLLPILQETGHQPDSDVRIINVSSASHGRVPTNPKPRFNSIEALNRKFEKTLVPGYSQYGWTKLANILFTKELQRRVDTDGITVMALHPGTIATDGLKGMIPLPKVIFPIVGTLFLSRPQGAYTTLIAATSPEVKKNATAYKGAYLFPFGKVVQPSEDARRKDLAEELWDASESVMRRALEAF